MSLIWAQVALFHGWRPYSCGYIRTPSENTKVDGCSFMAGMAQFSPFLGMYTFLNITISFDFVYTQMERSIGRINSTAHLPGFAQIITTNRFTVGKFSMHVSISLSIVRSASVVMFT